MHDQKNDGRFRFSLRAILICVTLVCIVAALLPYYASIARVGLPVLFGFFILFILAMKITFDVGEKHPLIATILWFGCAATFFTMFWVYWSHPDIESIGLQPPGPPAIMIVTAIGGVLYVIFGGYFLWCVIQGVPPVTPLEPLEILPPAPETPLLPTHLRYRFTISGLLTITTLVAFMAWTMLIHPGTRVVYPYVFLVSLFFLPLWTSGEVGRDWSLQAMLVVALGFHCLFGVFHIFDIYKGAAGKRDRIDRDAIRFYDWLIQWGSEHPLLLGAFITGTLIAACAYVSIMTHLISSGTGASKEVT